MEVQILPPKPELTERSADGYTGLFWKQVFAGSNPAALTNFSARVAKSAKAPVLETGY
jgi:hypothetical protein